MMTWMDDKVNGMFSTLLKLDGQRVTYRRGEQSKRLTMLVEDTAAERISENQYGILHTLKTFAFFAAKAPFGEPEQGDEIHLRGRRYALVVGVNKRYFDYDDPNELVMTIVAQRKGLLTPDSNGEVAEP